MDVEEFQWTCRTCSSEGPFQTDPEAIPEGWEDCPFLGLRCDVCVRNNVKPQ